MIVQVSPSLNIFDTLSYGYSGDRALLAPGVRVLIPLANRVVTGWVTDTESDYKGRVKNILGIVRDEFLPSSGYMDFVQAVSRVYFTSVGTLLDSAMPPKKKGIANLLLDEVDAKGKHIKVKPLSLAELQEKAGKGVFECFYKGCEDAQFPASVSRGSAGVAAGDAPLFEAETGGGDGAFVETFLVDYHREDGYREMMEETISRGKSVLLAVPDALTASYWQETLKGAGIEHADCFNSEIKPKERDGLWEAYVRGSRAGVLIGGLSAVLMPVGNLGRVIVDRSGSYIYKKRFFSVYHVNRLGRMRALYGGVPLVEGVSAPVVDGRSESSGARVDDGREKSEDGSLAKKDVQVRMIKQRTRGIPEDFSELVTRYFNEDKRILVVLNRKTGVKFLYCEKCKKLIKCPSCEGFLGVEEGDGGEERRGASYDVSCSRCDFERVAFNYCPRCNEELVMIEDISVSAVKKSVKSRVDAGSIMSFSSEGLKDQHLYSILKRMEAAQVVIATPVVLNPYFKNLFDAVIYMRPESFFSMEEYDAAEMIYSIVSELREMVKEGGTLDIFSTFHFHYSLKLINDEARFLERETQYREWFQLPPFANVYRIEVKGRELRKLGKEMRGMYKTYVDVLNIKKIYLTSHQKVRGWYKGVLEVHTRPENIEGSGLLGKRNVSVELVLN